MADESWKMLEDNLTRKKRICSREQLSLHPFALKLWPNSQVRVVCEICARASESWNMFRLSFLLLLLPCSNAVRSSDNETQREETGVCSPYNLFQNCCATAKCSGRRWERPTVGMYAVYETTWWFQNSVSVFVLSGWGGGFALWTNICCGWLKRPTRKSAR